MSPNVSQCLITSLACETKFRALQHPEHSEGATKISHSMFYKKVEEVGGLYLVIRARQQLVLCE